MKISRTAKSQQKQNREYWRKRIAVVQDNLFDKSEAQISARLAKHYEKALQTIRADMTDILMKVASGDYNMNELYKFDRYAKLQAKINEALKSLGASEIDIMTQEFKELCKMADSSIMSALGSDSLVGASFSVLDNKAVMNAVNQIWCADGQGWSSRIWKNKALLQSKLERGLVDCVARGGKSDDLKKILRETFGASFGESARLVRTELAQLQNSAAVARYKEAGVEEVETIACKDKRTCKICQKKDGKIHPIDKALPGIAYLFHPNCRCQVVPVLDVPDWTAEDRERIAQAEVDRLEKKAVEKSAEKSKINSAKDLSLLPVVDLPTGSIKISPSAVLDSLKSTDIGQNALGYLDENGLVARMKFGKVGHNDRGQQLGDNITIYLSNCKDATDAAAAVIHEVTHHKHKIGGCLWAEAVCFAQEYKHLYGKEKLTFAEKRKLIKALKKAYADQNYNWKKGGYKGGKKFGK